VQIVHGHDARLACRLAHSWVAGAQPHTPEWVDRGAAIVDRVVDHRRQDPQDGTRPGCGASLVPQQVINEIAGVTAM
jgi:hypothetical protein